MVPTTAAVAVAAAARPNAISIQTSSATLLSVFLAARLDPDVSYEKEFFNESPTSRTTQMLANSLTRITLTI